jgi:hypothetical protein
LHVALEAPGGTGQAGAEGQVHGAQFIVHAGLGVLIFGPELQAGDDQRHQEITSEDDAQQVDRQGILGEQIHVLA